MLIEVEEHVERKMRIGHSGLDIIKARVRILRELWVIVSRVASSNVCI
jgi:hypothetical protein